MSPVRMSKLEAAMRTVLAFNDAFNRHDVAGMMALMTEDCLFENTSPAPDGTVYAGRVAVTAFWDSFFQAAPQARIDIEEIFGMGKRCVMRWKYSWGHGNAAAGYVRGVDVFRVTGGLIREKLSYVKG
ncbi:MAG: nuclear transport factor 2 family protein [Caldilineaceae bacterium]|nr:nuclear transport factor 2 family protein [Caldilineaceae bacterium]HRJ41840.1 nuclear transport factor 2 family protein [Caldilineaceae bacterium]